MLSPSHSSLKRPLASSANGRAKRHKRAAAERASALEGRALVARLPDNEWGNEEVNGLVSAWKAHCGRQPSTLRPNSINNGEYGELHAHLTIVCAGVKDAGRDDDPPDPIADVDDREVASKYGVVPLPSLRRTILACMQARPLDVPDLRKWCARLGVRKSPKSDKTDISVGSLRLSAKTVFRPSVLSEVRRESLGALLERCGGSATEELLAMDRILQRAGTRQTTPAALRASADPTDAHLTSDLRLLKRVVQYCLVKGAATSPSRIVASHMLMMGDVGKASTWWIGAPRTLLRASFETCGEIYFKSSRTKANHRREAFRDVSGKERGLTLRLSPMKDLQLVIARLVAGTAVIGESVKN